MVFLCHLKEKQYTLSYGINWNQLLSKVKGISLVGKGMVRWLVLKSGSLKHCLTGAQMYYDGVNHFSMKYYHYYPMDDCTMACAKILGDPHIAMDKYYPKYYKPNH